MSFNQKLKVLKCWCLDDDWRCS